MIGLLIACGCASVYLALGCVLAGYLNISVEEGLIPFVMLWPVGLALGGCAKAVEWLWLLGRRIK